MGTDPLEPKTERDHRRARRARQTRRVEPRPALQINTMFPDSCSLCGADLSGLTTREAYKMSMRHGYGKCQVGPVSEGADQ